MPKETDIKKKIDRAQWHYQYSRTPRRKYSQTKWACKHKKIQFLLTLKDFIEMSTLSCFYCNCYLGDTGSSLDRVDNTLGYIITNIVPCCANCNRMKSNLPFDIFMQKIDLLYKNLLAKGYLKK